tara:strand:- start:2800 stop:3477 length:678 start_codon:yes stop_codon:yes gene_type:complete
MGEIILSARKIQKSYINGHDRLYVLNDLSLNVKKSEIISLMGQSGSGKSTALNILGTLDTPDAGSVEIDGLDIINLNDDELSRLRNQDIGFVFQFHHLLPEFSAIENVLIPTWINNKNNMMEHALYLFESLGLYDRKNHLPNQLSGGERSRVALIRGIINKPKILFADEPTGNLDVKNSMKLIDLLRKINEDLEQAIVLTTHNPEIASCGHKKYVLDKGVLKNMN